MSDERVRLRYVNRFTRTEHVALVKRTRANSGYLCMGCDNEIRYGDDYWANVDTRLCIDCPSASTVSISRSRVDAYFDDVRAHAESRLRRA